MEHRGYLPAVGELGADGIFALHFEAINFANVSYISSVYSDFNKRLS